ncbi:MerR family transcriptional regulator [Roseinatronobacter alkalisoli]|uniref:Helix-turn-helix domain-containing protein n=1 Tax=Roseinatronobacter alkalisoli TaxID=3028235 RepID=A0ABT5TDR9_9RHOB|nr:helix-turn-helix domain-containing protein [Roseinatronobacter sp. HJB301]MDD7973273.1 helix-turn-helix domain-containing protein [Roseinatronobacter sp. HJB301]
MQSIGKLSKATGVKVPTIRYYEQIGLLPEAGRSAGNQRLYDMKARDRLTFIRHARDLGFSLNDIRELLSLSDQPDMPCSAADIIARHQLVSVRKRITQLEALQQELERMLAQCAHGTISDCKVIEVLGNHEHCLHSHHCGLQRF